MIYQIIWLFADDTAIFAIVHDVNTLSKELNDDLKEVNDDRVF